MQQRVIVVGGGLAGQTAAIIAAQNGAHVTILEKEGRMGGNSAKATSGINGWGTPAQAAKGVLDGPAHFEDDTFSSGSGGDYRPSLVHMLSRRSTDAIHWLSSLGVPLSVLSQLGGHSRPRTHRAPDKPEGTPLPIGITTVSTLEKHIRGQLAGQVDIRTQARLRSLVHEHTVLPSGDCVTVVIGVEFEQPEAEKEQPAVQRLHADAVILATGGFSNDRTESSLLMEYAPHLAGFPTTNGPWATGDGVKIARELGVALVDMDKVQLHPTGLLNPKDPQGKTVFLGPEALRGSGGILLNKQGERFVNELDLRSVVSQAIIAQNNEFPGSGGRKFAYCVLNAAVAEAFGPAALGFYWKKMGLVRYAEDVAALAAIVGADAAVVQKTLEDYQTLSSTKEECPQTGKRVYPCVLGPEGPYYVAYVTPSIHYTMGGCLISPAAEIQSAQSTAFGDPLPILGLFGAGEVTGGVHGKNRLGGNSLLECVVFGKIAGERAARATTVEPRTTFSAGSMAEQPSTVLEYIGSAGGPRTVDLATTGGHLFLSLPNAAHISGLGLLQRVVVRHDGKERAVVPATSPSHLGRLGIVLPPRSEAPPEDAWLYDLTPGATVSLAAGPAVSGHVSTLAKELVVVVDGLHGHAVMHHLLRASLAEERQRWTSVRVLYVASGLNDARHAQELCARHQRATNGAAPRLSCTVLLTTATPEWEGEVGQLNMHHVRAQLPAAQPAENTLLVVSGRPNVLQVLAQELQAMAFQDEVNLLLLPP